MARADAHDRHRVVAGLLVAENRVLLCRRSVERAWYPGVWDLPGGHIEDDESPVTALCREMREELGVTVDGELGAPMTRRVTDEFDMQIWVIRQWSGDLTNKAPDEHDEIGWFTEEEVALLALADQSYPSLIADALNHGPPAPAADPAPPT
jgi:8-oxo-dGTP pyrophosphatase MutT (NUDIX family)